MQLLQAFKCALLLVIALGLGHNSLGQAPSQTSATGQPTEQPLSIERIEFHAKTANESPELDDKTKKTIAELYLFSKTEFKRATDLAARASAFEKDTETVTQRVAQIRSQLDELKGKKPLRSNGIALPELEQLHAKLELQLTAQKKTQATVKNEPKSRAQRRKIVRVRLVEIPAQLAELRKQNDSLPADEPAQLQTSRKIELTVRRLALEHEIPALEHELTKYDAEDAADLVRLQCDVLAQEIALVEQQLQLLEAQIKAGRAARAEQDVRKARDEAIAADPVLKLYAERNHQLAELAKSVSQKIDSAEKDLRVEKEVHERALRQFEQTRKKVESVGLTSSIGALLRKQRATLPDPRRRRATVNNRRMLIDQTHFELFEFDDERQELANPERLVSEIVAKGGTGSGNDRKTLESAAHDVLERKREYLDALIRGYNKYFDTVVELDTTEQQTITLSEQYRQYIDERVLWIRSGNVLTSELELDQSDAWIFSGYRWAEIPQRLWSDLSQNSILYGLAFLFVVFLLVRRRNLRRELQQIGVAVQRPTCCLLRPTLRSVMLTLAIAALWPGLIGFLAWRLNCVANGTPLTKAVGHGLFCLCAIWFPLEFLRQICRPKGLGEAHFAWPSSATQLLRRNLGWVILLILPLTFVTSTLFASDPTHGRDAAERTCFILQSIVLAVFVCRVFNPNGGVFHEYIAYHQGGWIDRLRYVWYWVGVAGPLAIACLAFWGFYYTSQVLSWRLYASMCFVVSLVLVRAILLRWIMLRRRKLSIEQARERTAAAAQNAEETATSLPAGIVTEPSEADLSAHSMQTQRLLATGMLATTLIGFWLIWVDVLPALKMLDQWPLWTTTTNVQMVEEPMRPLGPMKTVVSHSSSESQSAPTTVVRTEYQRTSITFTNLALAVLISIITVMAARNVPGLLEMSVLQRLPLDASVRYAITSLVSYGIVLLGVIVACSNVGLRWAQIQWLATALTFGLAFGLQEIFANFVAGIIILFERPVRVGDIVTVDDVTGVVSRIRIRATSITNWDRKEYVVPNKEFITGRLLNWTLSDKVNRIVITVGIAYGSDTERARDLLLVIAGDHPHVLKDPPSLATFESFGESSLNLTLRAFLPSMENRLQVIHELHTAIDRAFREAKIEIAFPQRDLHVRSMSDALELAPTASKSVHKQNEAA